MVIKATKTKIEPSFSILSHAEAMGAIVDHCVVIGVANICVLMQETFCCISLPMPETCCLHNNSMPWQMACVNGTGGGRSFLTDYGQDE
jgi:hypothetical protein